MKAILTTILTTLGSCLGQVLLKLFSAVTEALKFLNYRKRQEIEEKKEKERQEYNEKVKDACDNGQVEDLINL